MKKFRKYLIWLFIILLLLVGLYPLPYFVEAPGAAQPTSQFIQVQRHTDHQKGEFLFTTVAVKSGTALNLLLAKILPFQEILPKKAVLGDNNNQEYERTQRYFMENAGNSAIEVACKKAHVSYHKQYLGIYVMSILPQSHFKKHLRVGDTITQIDHQEFSNAQAFQHYVKTRQPGQKVTLTYKRQGKTRQVTRSLISLNKQHQSGIGITLVDHLRVHSRPAVQIHAGAIGGPSAGLMFALQIYAQLKRQDLTHGQIIAGTGTIDSQGNVGPIGGIDKKVYAAQKQHARIFFAPQEKITRHMKHVHPHYQTNYQLAQRAAQRLHSPMKIVPVTSFTDAINYLQTHH